MLIDPNASEAGTSDTSHAKSPGTSRVDWILWLLVALAPAIFALACWNPEREPIFFQAAARSYSLPITVIEISVIVHAILNGLNLKDILGAMPRWALAALGILVIVAVSTASTAANAGHSSIRTYQLLIHLLFGFSTCHLFQTRWAPIRPVAWPWVTVGTCLYVVVVVAWVLAVQDDPAFDWKYFGLGVVHIRQTGFYSAAGAAAALGVAAAARTPLRYWLAVGAASVMLALSYWSGTRGSLVAVLAAFAAGLLFLPGLRNWRAIGALAVSAVAGALLSLIHQAPHPYYGLLRISESTAVTGADELATGRVRMWEAAARAVVDRPFFGYGESQFGVAVPGWSQFNHPHNIVLQTLVQWGGVGFLCYFSLLGLVAWRVIGIARTGDPIFIAPFLAGASLVTMSFYEGSLYHPYPIMVVVLSAAFIMAGPRGDPRAPASD